MPTNDPHPTARALVEARELLKKLEHNHSEQQDEQTVVAALTAAHDAGRREGREEAAKRAETFDDHECHERNIAKGYRTCLDCAFDDGRAAAATDIRQLPLDDAARGEEPSDG